MPKQLPRKMRGTEGEKETELVSDLALFHHITSSLYHSISVGFAKVSLHYYQT